MSQLPYQAFKALSSKIAVSHKGRKILILRVGFQVAKSRQRDQSLSEIAGGWLSDLLGIPDEIEHVVNDLECDAHVVAIDA